MHQYIVYSAVLSHADDKVTFTYLGYLFAQYHTIKHDCMQDNKAT